jgi:hypothetical protein
MNWTWIRGTLDSRPKVGQILTSEDGDKLEVSRVANYGFAVGKWVTESGDGMEVRAHYRLYSGRG